MDCATSKTAGDFVPGRFGILIRIRKDWPAQMVLPESVRLVTVTIKRAVFSWMGKLWFLVDD